MSNPKTDLDNKYDIYHVCESGRSALLEGRIDCKKPNHVFCMLCKECNNEFHLTKQKYVPSFDVA